MLVRYAAAALALLVSAGASALPLPPHPEHEVTAQDVVLKVPGMDRVTVKKNVPFKRTDAGSLRMDLYYPPDFKAGSRLPAVVFINGVGGRPREPGLKEWNIYASWGRLVAASGWIGVTFDTRGPFLESGPDILDLFRFVRSDGEKLGIQPDRIAAWVCSANVTSGLKVLMENPDLGVRAAVVYYGTSDVVKIRTDLPVFLVKAGLDNERLNTGIDALFGRAEAAGAPWTFVLAPNSHHAFDALDETEESRRIVRETLAFFREYLSPPPPPAEPPSLARRALGHWFANEYAEAAADYGEYVRLHPQDGTAWMRLGICQAHVKKTAEAEASLQKAFALGADTPIDLYNLACGYALINQPDKALDYLERAVAGGYGEKRRVAADEDLASLRDLDRFQKILEKLP